MKILSYRFGGKFTRCFTVIIILAVFNGCVKNREFNEPATVCENILIANASFEEIKSLYQDKTFQIQEDLIIEGYIISSDEASNFFSVLHFQDASENPTDGFQIEIDLRNTHLFYEVGDKILIKLKGLYLGKTKGVYRLGGVFSSFGNETVGRLPSAAVFEHILVACNENKVMMPRKINISELDESLVNTLVAIDSLEFFLDDLSLTFAEERKETKRRLVDCKDNELVLLNSGFSEFQSTLLSEGNGSIIGVLTIDKEQYQIIIRTLNDINFEAERCEDLLTEFTSPNIFFSELADPNNNSGARFVELYNSGDTSISLNGWKILRYTIGSISVSSTLDLSGFKIERESALVISANKTEFENVYGFTPDIATSSNSPADSNGDDNLQLIDPFGTLIDVFGIIGEDGSGTNHEFEDGRAFRISTITQGNTNYEFLEWEISNDTGASGTCDNPKNAPDDFTPGIRI